MQNSSTVEVKFWRRERKKIECVCCWIVLVLFGFFFSSTFFRLSTWKKGRFFFFFLFLGGGREKDLFFLSLQSISLVINIAFVDYFIKSFSGQKTFRHLAYSRKRRKISFFLHFLFFNFLLLLLASREGKKVKLNLKGGLYNTETAGFA